jgi:hypothetical protein
MMRKRRRRPFALTPLQNARIVMSGDKLPEPLRYSFVLRVDLKLAMRGSNSFSDNLVSAVIAASFAEIGDVNGRRNGAWHSTSS